MPACFATLHRLCSIHWQAEHLTQQLLGWRLHSTKNNLFRKNIEEISTPLCCFTTSIGHKSCSESTFAFPFHSVFGDTASQYLAVELNGSVTPRTCDSTIGYQTLQQLKAGTVCRLGLLSLSLLQSFRRGLEDSWHNVLSANKTKFLWSRSIPLNVSIIMMT